MYPVTTCLEGFHHLNYPDVCTEEPKYGKAFGELHCTVAEHNSIPSDLKEYHKFHWVKNEISSNRIYTGNVYGTPHFLSMSDYLKFMNFMHIFCYRAVYDRARFHNHEM